MVLLALITAPAAVARILDHLRTPSTPPPIAPARVPASAYQTELLGDPYDQTDPLDPRDEPHRASSHHTAAQAAVPKAPP